MKILLVEDYAPIREAVADGLREAGYAVDAAADGDTGLRLAAATAYDVIVLDLMLPGVDGLTILRRIRAAGSQANVLVLTARDTTADRVTGLDLGADDYLVKPFAFEELLARVRALLRRNYDAQTPTIRVADVELHAATRSARRAGRPLALGAREYALLELLAARAGRVVTRAEIWEHVYAFHAEAESNVVEVLIFSLRRKLETDGLPRLIHTRRGQGYVLGNGDE